MDALVKRERGRMVSTFSHSVSAVIFNRVSNRGTKGARRGRSLGRRTGLGDSSTHSVSAVILLDALYSSTGMSPNREAKGEARAFYKKKNGAGGDSSTHSVSAVILQDALFSSIGGSP